MPISFCFVVKGKKEKESGLFLKHILHNFSVSFYL